MGKKSAVIDPESILAAQRELSDEAFVEGIAFRQALPKPAVLTPLFKAAAKSMEALSQDIRPPDDAGKPGALIELSVDLPTLVLPDLHARPQVLTQLLKTHPPLPAPYGLPDKSDASVSDLLLSDAIQVVMVGDGPHSEGRSGAERWRAAYREYLSSWATDKAMREEMTLAFTAMELVARLIAAFPGRFFFLKGNHDNIWNREGGGDHGFGKYAEEGAMAASWTEAFMGKAFIKAYDEFERALPLMARGPGFLATHAEPAFTLTEAEVINARSEAEVVEALTWTDNDAADPEAVNETLQALLGPSPCPGVILGGHRPVAERFGLRAGGRYVQIHDVGRMQAALLIPWRPFDPLSGIIDLG